MDERGKFSVPDLLLDIISEINAEDAPGGPQDNPVGSQEYEKTVSSDDKYALSLRQMIFDRDNTIAELKLQLKRQASKTKKDVAENLELWTENWEMSGLKTGNRNLICTGIGTTVFSCIGTVFIGIGNPEILTNIFCFAGLVLQGCSVLFGTTLSAVNFRTPRKSEEGARSLHPPTGRTAPPGRRRLLLRAS
ncbi:MAG: hypothetical protein LBQ12_09810 [Deltaproteobacteria bacterium]|jgi:hypothetical protein|nr:hypothetical protein [Deltaproteobacteria bacterium]